MEALNGAEYPQHCGQRMKARALVTASPLLLDFRTQLCAAHTDFQYQVHGWVAMRRSCMRSPLLRLGAGRPAAESAYQPQQPASCRPTASRAPHMPASCLSLVRCIFA